MIFYLLWYNVIPWSSHIYKKTSFLSFHCLIFSVNNTGETIESNWQNVIHVELNGIKNSIMQLTFFLDGPMANSLFYFFKKKWLLNKNLVLILLLIPNCLENFSVSITAWKVSAFGVILVCIFPNSDWIWT